MNREKDFKSIQKSLSSSIQVSIPFALLVEGDSLNLLKSIPDNTISLILTDPPYHSTKKDNIYGDTAFKEDDHYLDWMEQYAKEWKRVLKPNGSLYCFCSPAMVAGLENRFSNYFNILSQIVWTKPNEPGFDGWKQKMNKEALRQWYSHSERIIFAEPAHEGNLHRSYFGNLLREQRRKANLTCNELTAKIGAHGKVNHGGAVSNWEAGRNIPSRDQYKKLCAALIKTGKVESMPDYEDAIRAFNIDGSKEFTDIWTFPNLRPYKGKHPAEKPMNLLEHAIEATTYPGDIVLDCFSGSGNTIFAALKLGRLGVAIEIDSTWIKQSALKLKVINKDKDYDWKALNLSYGIRKKIKELQPSLFSVKTSSI